MKIKYQILLGISLFLPFFSWALTSEQKIKNNMLSDIDFIHNIFEIYYAPKEWKKSHLGWNLKEEIEKAIEKVKTKSNITTKEYQQIIKQFFHSTQDYHTTVFFYSTEKAKLPFSVKGVHGRYFISFVEKSELPPYISLEIGDELISFNGTPTKEVVQEIMAQNGGYPSNKETDHSIASYLLTKRIGELGHHVPSGLVSFEIKHKNSQMKHRYKLEWSYEPEKFSNAFEGKLLNDDELDSKKTFFDKNLKLPNYEALKSLIKMNSLEEESFIGSRVSFVPPLSEDILWRSNPGSPFHAYLYQICGEKIGYVRIANYDGNKFEFEKFGEIIGFLERNSSALVIDQVDNPGGSISYLFNLLTVLTDRPLLLPTQRMMITYEEVEFAFSMIEILSLFKKKPELLYDLKKLTDFEYLDDDEQVNNYFNYFSFIISEWNAGRNFTEPYYLSGFSRVMPSESKVHYTRPILVLINSLAMSGGDFFPAVLQDNKRATLFGTPTAGAGGAILETTFPNRFGIKRFTYTASIAERLDKKIIENLGVSPDIEYRLTEHDYQNNYQRYVDAINTAVLDLCQK
jgi:hypothetical protein